MKRSGPIILLAFCALVLLTMPLTAQEKAFDLQQAVAAAQPGHTIVVPAGVYAGPFVITRPITLEGQGSPVIDGGGTGDVITIKAPDVTIRGFVVRNSGDSLDREHAGITGEAANLTIENNRLEDVLFGIYLKNAPGSVVRNNVVLSKDLEIGRRGDGIKVWYGAGTLLEGNRVSGSRDVIVWFSPHSIIRNNLVEEGRYGLHFMSNEDETIENNVLRKNSVGIYLMYGKDFIVRNNLLFDSHGPSGYGLALKDVDNVHAEGNRMVSNRVGVYVDGSPLSQNADVRMEHNLFAYNETGIEMLPSVQHNTYTNNVFQENGTQIAIAGGGELIGNNWEQEGRGNYWSDYTGFDANGDHIGDLPYKSQSLYEDLMEKYPELQLFRLSPATDALDLAARAFPVFAPRVKMADDRPLMVPPSLPDIPGLVKPPLWANLAAALGMLTVSALVLFFGTRVRSMLASV